MKSFDEMADEFVDGFSKSVAPKVVSDSDRKVLWIGFMAGMCAGFKFCYDAVDVDDKEARGL